MAEHKTDMYVTKIKKCKNFYNGAQNRTQLHFRNSNNEHIEI